MGRGEREGIRSVGNNSIQDGGVIRRSDGSLLTRILTHLGLNPHIVKCALDWLIGLGERDAYLDPKLKVPLS